MKSISIVNYVKVLVLFILTTIIVFSLANNYKEKIEYEKISQDIMNFLSTIKYEELSNYLVENHDGFIYMSSSSNVAIEEFENDFKKYIIEDELEHDFVYLDSNGYADSKYNDFKSKFLASTLSSVTIDSMRGAMIMAVRDGRIIDILYVNSENTTIDDVRKFVGIYRVME